MPTTNRSEWRTTRFRLNALHRTPKQTPEVVRFRDAHNLFTLLPARGWGLVKKGPPNGAAWFVPPPGTREPYIIELLIPSRAEIIRLGRAFHADGVPWSGRLEELPARYLPERRIQATSTSFFDPGVPPQVSEIVRPPIFEIGILYTPWHASVEWKDGRETCSVDDRFVVAEDPLIEPASVRIPFVEGGIRLVELDRYERDPAARRACLTHYGTSCQACGTHLETVYGAIGRNVIHVHHLTPLSHQAGEHEVDPIRDLLPLCPNCHAIVHRRDPPLGVEELRSLLAPRRPAR